MMELIPRPGYVVLQEAKSIVDNSAVKKLDIYIPEEVQEMTNQGKVIKMPEGDTSFKEGDYVIFKRHLYDELTIANVQYLLGKLEDITAIIKVIE